MTRPALILGLFLGASVGCARAHKFPAPPADGSRRSTVVGEVAPDIALRSLDGGSERLSSYRGRVVIVTFWSTSCGPCLVELPELEKLQGRYPELVVLAISLDDDDDDKDVRDAVNRLHLTFPILRDPDGRAGYQFMKYLGTPYTVVVGRDGRLRARHVGYLPQVAALLEQEARTMLAEPAAAGSL
jgi:peroxiredoxin